MTSLSEELAAFCCGFDARTLRLEVIDRLKSAVLDGIASMLAGVREPVAAQVVAAAWAAAGGSTGDCTVVGFNWRAPLSTAALVNGTIAHACDYDDSGWTMWGHPTAPLLPALLACAESRECPGLDLLAAFAAGLEVEKAFGLLMQPEHYRRGWHPTATLGLFGAVAGAGRLLGLSAFELQAAFGIAASMSAGLRSNAGYGAKPLHTGLAARNGVEAALLAQAGMSANPLALEGPGGVMALYGTSGDLTIEDAIGRLGQPFEIVEPGLSPKLYPCCSDIHCAIDIVFDEMAAQGFSAGDVEAVRCFVAPMAEPNVRRRDPQTATEAKFSMSYCLACALVHGRVGLAQFTADALRDETVRAVASCISVAGDPALAADGGETFSSPASVEIDLRDGRRLRTFLREMRGHPDRPLSPTELVRKFMECAGTVMMAGEARALYAQIGRIETLPSLADLMRRLGGPARPRLTEAV